MKSGTRSGLSVGHSHVWVLVWLVVCAIAASLVVVLVTTVSRQPEADSSVARRAQAEARENRVGAATGQKKELAPGNRIGPSPVAPSATSQPQHADPFKAFLEASGSGQRPLSAEPTAGPPARQAVERDDPFRSIAEKTKNRGDEVTKSPFGR